MGRQRNLQLDWLKHIDDPKERKSFEDLVRNSRLLLGRLKDIVDERLQALERQEGMSEMYDSGYPYRQAHINGKRQALNDLRKLVEFLD